MDLSVIIPIYKGEKYLKYWLDIIEANKVSLQKVNSTYSFEILFVNDYPGEALTIEKSICEKLNIKVYNLPNNRGIHGARVFGYEQARGTYIVFLDQDDKIADNYFLSQLENVGENDVVVCNGYYERFCMSVKRIIFGTIEQHMTVMYEDTFIKNWNAIWSPGQVIIRKAAIPSIWTTNIMRVNGADDYFLWILMHKDNRKYGINAERLYTHVDHGDNVSNNSGGMNRSVEEMLSILESNGILTLEESNMIREKNAGIYGKTNKSMGMFILYDYWMHLKINNKSTAEYFKKHKYKNIAIYGMNYMGSRLYDELNDSDINVVLGIDQNANSMECGIPIYELEKSSVIIDKTDVVVVTAVNAYNEIEKAIKEKYDIPVVSIKDILIELCAGI